MLDRLRHFAALLMGVLVLQLVLLGARASCGSTTMSTPENGTLAAAVQEQADVAAQAASDHQAHRHHGASPQVPASDDERQSHDHDGPLHCPTGMACATIGIAGDAAVLPTAALGPALRVASLDAAAPAPVASAPEPPPPRG